MKEVEIVSRSEAKAAGLVRYFTGKPCVHGHTAMRYASTGQCAQCVENNKSKHPPVSERAKNGKARRNKRWSKKTQSLKSERGRAWRQGNRDVVRAHVLNRRALRQRATPPWFSEFDQLVMLEAADLAQRREVATGFPWHVDHMLPMKCSVVTGLHVAINMQVIPAAMNVAKGNKLQLTEPGEWLRAI